MRVDGIQHRIPNVVDLPIVFFKEIFFEGKNDKHARHGLLELDRAFLIPCPDLWSDVVEHLYLFFSCKLCNPHIKSTVVNQDYYVWIILKNILLTFFCVTRNGIEILHYFNESHERKLAIM